jgi:hypothetical protein
VPGLPDRAPDVLISIRNAGRRTVTIRAFGIRVGRQALVMLPKEAISKFLKTLADGEVLEYTAPFHPTLVDLADALPRPYLLSQWTLRLWALTTVDVRPSARVSADLRRKIV